MLKKETKVASLQSSEFRSRKSIIKSNAVRQSPLRKVAIKAHPIEKYEFPSQKSTVVPIMDNGLVVGVHYRCHCGENTEISFELEKSTSSEILES